MTARRYGAWTGMVAGICGCLLSTLFAHSAPRLIWNVTASSPRGPYIVLPVSRAPRAGDFVAAWLPPAARVLAARRHYLPLTVPVVKRVAAVGGARVCARGRAIEIDGRIEAYRRSSDQQHRPLPQWSGCLRLRSAEMLLLSADQPASFDSRYFGPVGPAELIGRAVLLWQQ